MKIVNFVDGMKPLTSDMNNLHGYVEDALYTLLKALGGSSGSLLFNSEEPTASVNSSGTLTITVAEQYFAIDGAVAKAPNAVKQHTGLSSTDAKVGVYFILKKVGVEDERNFIALDTPSEFLIQQDLTTTVAYDDIARVETVITTDGSDPEDPPLGAGDVGLVRLGTYDWEYGTDTLTFALNTAAVFTLPENVQQAITTHAASHLPGGGDEIDVSELDNVAGGSTPGLMPAGALTAALGSVQDIISDDSFLQISMSGDNDVSGNDITPKTATIHLALDGSLAVNQDDELSVVFLPPSTRNGTVDIAARIGHVHALIETGVISYTMILDIPQDGSLLGKMLGPYTVSSVSSGGSGTDDVGRLISIRVSWIPPGIPGNYYGVDCGWSVLSNSGQETIGCRSVIMGQTAFYLETGDLGLAYLTSTMINHINGITNGIAGTQPASQPNWLSGSYADGGRLKVDVIAVRVGAHSDSVEVL